MTDERREAEFQRELVEHLRELVGYGIPLHEAMFEIHDGWDGSGFTVAVGDSDRQIELLIYAAAEIEGVETTSDDYYAWAADVARAYREYGEGLAKRYELMADGLRELYAQAAAEGREVTDEEILALSRRSRDD
jgi:hypothetical protein